MAKSKNRNFTAPPPKKVGWWWGVTQTAEGESTTKYRVKKIHEDRSSQTFVACRRSSKTAMDGQIGLFAILNRTPNLTGIRYKAETWQFS